MRTFLMQRGLTEEKQKQIMAAKKAIAANDVVALERILAAKYQQEGFSEKSNSDSHDLGADIEGKQYVAQTFSYAYIDIEQDGPELILYAVNHGDIAVIKKLEELGAHITLDTIKKYAPVKPKDNVTEHIYYSILKTKINALNSTDIVPIFTKLSNGANASIYHKLLEFAKDEIYLKGSAEQLEATQALFQYDKEYIRNHRVPIRGSDEKTQFLRKLSADPEMAAELQNEYAERNRALIEGVKGLKKQVEDGKGFFTAKSRQIFMKSAMDKIEKLNITNEATKFREIINIIIEANNEIQKELNNSIRASLGISRNATTKTSLDTLLNKFRSDTALTPNYKLDIDSKTQLVKLGNDSKISIDEEIINTFALKAPGILSP